MKFQDHNSLDAQLEYHYWKNKEEELFYAFKFLQLVCKVQEKNGELMLIMKVVYLSITLYGVAVIILFLID